MVDFQNTEFDINSAWGDFCEGEEVNLSHNTYNNTIEEEAPKSSDIYISTKTKISYLNQEINLSEVFWKLPVIDYHCQETGIVKKQMKFNSTNEAELNNILEKIPENTYTEQNIITRIINPSGRIQFKDVRKISIGLCKKDIISYRGKQKGAFYNCFVILLRILIDDTFKEVHVKVFNTGKLEIPGMRDDKVLYIALKLLVDILNKNIESSEVFRCGFYLNRELLYDILKNKYRINCSYDSCSYPGIQCEFYYDSSLSEQTGQQPKENDKTIIKVSFMIFRTGSALIVGKCTEEVLHIIYRFLCNLLRDEYKSISCGINKEDSSSERNVQRKVNKKKIVVTV